MQNGNVDADIVEILRCKDYYALMRKLVNGTLHSDLMLGERMPIIHRAIEDNDLVMASILIRHKCNLEATTYYSWTALQHACRRNLYDMSLLLLSAGANVNATHGASSKTPLSICADNNQLMLAKLLLMHGADYTIISDSGQNSYDYAKAKSNEEMCVLLKTYSAV